MRVDNVAYLAESTRSSFCDLLASRTSVGVGRMARKRLGAEPFLRGDVAMDEACGEVAPAAVAGGGGGGGGASCPSSGAEARERDRNP